MEKTKNLAAFKRIWAYVWPQWPRVVAVFFWAGLMACMLSVSIVAMIPVLKVMMGEEGLHGYVDRNICDKRYGMDFYLPNKSDLSSDAKTMNRQLVVVSIKKDSWAQQAGLELYDRILGVSQQPDGPEMTAAMKMQEILATCTPGQILKITLKRTDGQSATVVQTAPAQLWYADAVQWVAGHVPRSETDEHKFQAIMVIMIAMVVITIFRCLARFYQAYLGAKIVNIAVMRIREDVFRHVMFMSIGFFSARGTSDTTSRILGDVGVTGKGIKVLLGKAVREPFTAIAMLAVAFGINWQLTAIFLSSAPVVIGLFAILGKKMKRATKKTLVITAHILGRIQGAMNALPVVKVYNRQQHEIDHYQKANRSLLRQNLKKAKIEVGTNPLLDVMGMITMSAAILVGAAWVSGEYPRLQPTEFFILIGLLGGAAESIRKVSNVWNSIQQANAAAERVFAVIDEPRELEAADAVNLQPLCNNIKFNDIVFTYPGANTQALKGINLSVPAGQTVAVVGPNGSGKSTLVNLLPRFYDPDSGQIGKPDATTDEIVDAAKRAFAHEFIEPLPDGYDTVIGENSAGFSGGQLQRMVIARAILKNPQILIFDEAMSQIDADSESKIHEALQEIMKGRTCFLIAHRFSTIISADRIVVIDEGRIVADGTHDELITSSDVYKRLYETQLLGT
ncbi:MAG: hypothetical protein B6I25_03055 [Planctomycetales bacterium 4572_13]|nr:MAG: hypothetical protein B6I25_03055 [Planctomycetales bacterium 4572_13]